MRILLAGLLAGIAMYVWSTIAHVATPLATIGVQTLPDESVTVGNLASAIGDKGGLFVFPHPMGASASTSPGGFLVFNPHAPTGIQPKNLIIEFLTELVEAMIAAWLLAQTALAGYGARVGFVTAVGVVGAIVTNVPYWNWYTFPTDYTLAYSVIEIVGFLVAGLVLAWMIRPKTA